MKQQIRAAINTPESLGVLFNLPTREHKPKARKTILSEKAKKDLIKGTKKTKFRLK
jgi:hypothetical protein